MRSHQSQHAIRGIILLVALLLLVVPACAWQEDFQSGTASGWTTYTDPGTSVSIVTSPHLDTYELRLYAPDGNYVRAWANPQQSFNYAAFTSSCINRKDSWIKVYLYDSAGSTIASSPDLNPYLTTSRDRVEIERDGDTVKLYVNGILSTSFSCSGQPYNIMFERGRFKYVTYTWDIDDVVIGVSEPDILGIIPADWYVLKHPTDPTLSGLYNSTGNNVYRHAMHVTYGLDNPADANTRIVLRSVDSGTDIYSTPLTAGTYHGVVTINITETLINNPDAYGGNYSILLMQGDVVYDQGFFTYDGPPPPTPPPPPGFRPRATATIDNVSTSLVDDLINSLGGETVPEPGEDTINWTGLISTIAGAYTSILGPLAYTLIFSIPFLMMWITQRDMTLPGLVGALLGLFIIVRLPAEFHLVAVTFIVISIVAVVYSLVKERV